MTGGFCSIFRGIQLFNSLGEIQPLLRGVAQTRFAVGIVARSAKASHSIAR
jgi:hypothetical protein